MTLKPEVVTLHTASRSIRGPGAIGFATHERRLKAVVGRRLRCRTTRSRGFCVVGSFATGRRSTVFDLRRRWVVAVTISVSTP